MLPGRQVCDQAVGIVSLTAPCRNVTDVERGSVSVTKVTPGEGNVTETPSATTSVTFLRGHGPITPPWGGMP